MSDSVRPSIPRGRSPLVLTSIVAEIDWSSRRAIPTDASPTGWPFHPLPPASDSTPSTISQFDAVWAGLPLLSAKHSSPRNTSGLCHLDAAPLATKAGPAGSIGLCYRPDFANQSYLWPWLGLCFLPSSCLPPSAGFRRWPPLGCEFSKADD